MKGHFIVEMTVKTFYCQKKKREKQAKISKAFEMTRGTVKLVRYPF